jgi:hypothetical protein
MIQAKIAGISNVASASDIILGKVDQKIASHNTLSTAHNDIRTAIQALQNAGFQSEAQVNALIAALVDSSPDSLDTLKEFAEALGNDPNFATTMINALADKVDKEAGKGLSTNDFTNKYRDYIDFCEGTQTRTSVASVPVTVATTFATISSNQTFSLSGTLVPGRTYTVRIKASGAQRTVALPTTGAYVTNDTSSIVIPNGKEAEISVMCVTASEYSLRVIEP